MKSRPILKSNKHTFFNNKIENLYNNPVAKAFLIVILIFGVSTGIFLGVLNNYLHEILHITKMERGIIELPREFPGLLLVVFVTLLYKLCETRILRLSILIAIVGIVGLSFWGETRWIAIVMIVLWSTGEHLIMPVWQSMGVHMAKPGKEGLALGVIRSARNLGQVIGFYLIPLIIFILISAGVNADGFVQYRMTFMIAGLALFLGLGFSFKLKTRKTHLQRKGFYIRKKFWRYYILEMFFGARKQVFLTFAPYVLIVLYGASIQVMAVLFGIYSTINIFIAPVVGKMIDRWGYRRIIIFDTIILVLLCLIYGFAHRLFPQNIAFWVVALVFIVDAVLFVVTVARTVYVKTIAEDQNEVTSTLSSGISINHLVSIMIAVLGGLLWQALGVEALFMLAAFFGVGSFVFALHLPKPS